jgi:hypothetical protein
MYMSSLSSLATLLALTLALTACGTGRGPSNNADPSASPSASPSPSPSSSAPAPSGEQVTFTNLSQRNSQIQTARTETVTTADAWEKLWSEHMGSDSDRPEVDFEKEAVVAVFAGQKPTGGYSVTIQAVSLSDKTLQVAYSEKSPSPDSITTQVISYPSHIVKIDKAPSAFSSTRFTKQ